MRVKLRLGRSPKPEIPVYCVACNNPIAPDATECGSCHAPIVRRYCPKCSRLVPENSKLCPYCGVSSKAKASNIPSSSNFVLFVLLGAAVLYILIGGLFSVGKSRKLQSPEQLSKTVAPAPKAGARIVPVSNGITSVVRSDAEGEKLNLEGYSFIQQKNYKAAEPVLRRAVQSFVPGTTSVSYKFALYNLGHVLRRTGRPKEAVQYLEKCVKLDPSWSKAQSELNTAKAEAHAATQISLQRLQNANCILQIAKA